MKALRFATPWTAITGEAYESLLERLFAVERLPAWRSNRLKRLVKQPKRHVVEPALIAAALGLDETGVVRDGDMLGRIVESFVVAQLRPELVVSRSKPRLFHLRTHEGRQEIDLIAELGGGRVIAIEIKSTAAPEKSDARSLIWLRDQLGDRFAGGVVFHTGPRVFQLDDQIQAVPIAALWA